MRQRRNMKGVLLAHDNRMRRFWLEVAYDRYRVNDMGPELVALRSKLLEAEIARRDASEKAIRIYRNG